MLALAILFWLAPLSESRAQTTTYNLKQLFEAHQIELFCDTAKPLSDGNYQGITCTGIAWLKGVNFTTGSIDIDLRGRDILQQSFLGIAFHGVDTTTYDAIYFRPFNFQSRDTLRLKHQVQYISQPYYTWNRLRAEHPLVYESSVDPRPIATAWFHAHIVVTADTIRVYVNHSTKPSLVVKMLNQRTDGRIGIWDGGVGGYTGDFANLVITNDK